MLLSGRLTGALTGFWHGPREHPAGKVRNSTMNQSPKVLTSSEQDPAKSAVPDSPRLRRPVVARRGVFRPDPPAYGLRERLELAYLVPENICVRSSYCSPHRSELILGRHLKPGQGWIEHVEIDLKPRCTDGTIPADSMLLPWYNYLIDATARVDRPIAYNHNTRELLENAGFIDIHEEVIRAPYNSWPNDPHQKEIGRWYNLGLTEGLEALSFAPFTRVNQWDLHQHVKPLVETVRREIRNRKIHAYNNM